MAVAGAAGTAALALQCDAAAARPLLPAHRTPRAPRPVPQIIPKGDRVLVKVGEQEEKTRGGILLPASAQKRPTSGERGGCGLGRGPSASTPHQTSQLPLPARTTPKKHIQNPPLRGGGGGAQATSCRWATGGLRTAACGLSPSRRARRCAPPAAPRRRRAPALVRLCLVEQPAACCASCLAAGSPCRNARPRPPSPPPPPGPTRRPTTSRRCSP